MEYVNMTKLGKHVCRTILGLNCPNVNANENAVNGLIGANTNDIAVAKNFGVPSKIGRKRKFTFT